MTAVETTRRGVEKRIENICGACVFFKRLSTIPCWDRDRGLAHTGICEEKGSDHYGHVLDQAHPRCVKRT